MDKSKQAKTHSHQHPYLSPIELAMMVLSLVSVVLVLMLAFTKMDSQTRELFFLIDTGICLIFLSHFFTGLIRSIDKKHFIKHHWIDFIASIPAIEPLRMMRMFQILRVIRLIRSARSLLLPLLRQRSQTTLASLLLAMVLILSLSSIFILLVESGVDGANIHTAQDAIWWSIVTISTVGYGDFYPVTTAGHVIGTIVILCGVSFFGVISGYMASVFVAPEQKEQSANQQQERQQEVELLLTRMETNQQQILAEIAHIREKLAHK